jgi:serine/threonine-protein kinase RsbW
MSRGDTVRIKVAMWLPRTVDSVAVARQALDRIFTAFGVRPDCRQEISLAVSEACSNVVRHASGPSTYEVAAESQDSECVIVVNDGGPGLGQTEPTGMPDVDAVAGRGFALMRLTTDQVEVRARHGGGLSVRMFKRLRWSDGALGGMPP